MPKILQRVTIERQRLLSKKRQQAHREKRKIQLQSLRKCFKASESKGFNSKNLKLLRRRIVALEKIDKSRRSTVTDNSSTSSTSESDDENDERGETQEGRDATPPSERSEVEDSEVHLKSLRKFILF